MAMMSLQQAAQILGVKSVGPMMAEFSGVSTDTRKIKEGDLFVALKGPNFDGHEFIKLAHEKGAVGAIVDHVVLDNSLPQLIVEDTRLALGQLAAAWRKRFTGTVIGVTGSNGKTTVKEMLASIFSSLDSNSGAVLATEGNLNNDIGVPLMLFRLNPEQHKYAVLEMGANHVGEISYLTNLVKPDVAMITNAAAAHLEGFGSLDDVARAKGEIWQGLGDSGVAVINADDAYAGYWRELVGDTNYVTFGLVPGADVCLGEGGAHWSWQDSGDSSFKNQFELKTSKGDAQITLALAGKHNVTNAIASAAAAIAAGVSLDGIQAGLGAMRPVDGRLQPKRAVTGQLVIDDSYNANPHSLNAAIDVLAQSPEHTILIMGDMAELGDDAKKLHFQVGERASKEGIKQLMAVGPFCKEAVRGFDKNGFWFETKEKLIGQLKKQLASNEMRRSVVLVKGSRSAGMEQVVNALLAGDENATSGKAGGGAC